MRTILKRLSFTSVRRDAYQDLLTESIFRIVRNANLFFDGAHQLLVFDHQMHAINLLTRLNWESRVASGTLGPLVSELADYLLFVNEAPLSVPLTPRAGFAEHLAAKTPMRKDAVFRMASMSKPVTGVAIMMLLEEGKVRLTDPVSRFIPEFKDTKVAVPVGVPAPGAAAAGCKLNPTQGKRQ